MEQTQKNKPSALKIVLCVIGALFISVVSFWIGFGVRGAVVPDELSTIKYILSMYHAYYYDELKSEDIIGLFEDALLDDYSDYYTPEQYELIFKASQGSHEGIGISIDTQNFSIADVAWNSPCDRAGVKADGVITGYKLNESEPITQLIAPSNGGDANAFSNAMLQIPAGTPFILEVEYNGEKQYFTVAREEYTETFVRYYSDQGEFGYREIDGEMKRVKIGDNNSYDLEGRDDVAVIDYNGFAGLRDELYGSAGQMADALKLFKEQGKRNLILDLRSNGGGYMDILCDVSSHFVGVGNGISVPISAVLDKNEEGYKYNSTAVDYNDYNFNSIVVLGDAGTASASEALIGAMLDYDASDKVKVIVEGVSYKVPDYEAGEFNVVTEYRTYGKGIMQSTFENIFSGGAIKLTTHKIFWPITNTCIHGVGVTTALNEVYGKTKVINASALGSVHDALSLSK